MNTFSLYKGKILLVVALIALLGLFIYFSVSSGFSIITLALCGLIAACILIALTSSGATGGGSPDALTEIMLVSQEIDMGNFEARITKQADGQVKDVYDAVNSMIDRTDAFVREAAAAMEYVAQKRYFRYILETGMTGAFLKAARDINASIENLSRMQASSLVVQDKVTTVVGNVVANSRSIVQEAENMGGRIDKSSSGTIEVAEAAIQTSESITLVAAAAEELAASVREITRQVSYASETSQTAMNNVNAIQDDIKMLSAEANNIGEVIQLISDIAAKTNLLALNATVEAARAGEAGKGFAVVAAEVKNLADQTSKATDRISDQIGNIQDATEGVVSKSRDIYRTIEEINEVSAAIAAAVEEQGAATNDISDKVGVVATQSSKVSDRISDIAQASAGSYAGAITVIWAADDQIKPVEELDVDLKAFFKLL
ncbi:methyl-accepting chemotaxis protein [Terasakiella pusilla]|uniref:methyl-accepting chemotaxis protein n=1 Tax=Terasakiella pusilla TaxID=64973 RepID=UPI00068B288C|nr:methyl-accepting chemotaxis protein [Terasakiella pusilla]